MTLPLLILLLTVVSIYWTKTQVLPERRRLSLLRPNIADGLLMHLNDRRHERGLPILEIDDDLMLVAENKATHQSLTGLEDDGWDYPRAYAGMLGRSLLMEVLLIGRATVIGDRLACQEEVLDGEWIRCGIGVAAGQPGELIVALVLCREAWEPAVETGHVPILERVGLRD